MRPARGPFAIQEIGVDIRGKANSCFSPPMAYNFPMVFIETPIFTRLILELLTDDEYRTLQLSLTERPEQGSVIRGSGGIRKVRAAAKGMGKSGGIRVIYYWVTARGQIYMLLAYPKNRKDNLTAEELAALRALVVKELGHG